MGGEREKIFGSNCDSGFLLGKIGVNQPKHIENARILVANMPVDTDKVKIGFGIWGREI